MPETKPEPPEYKICIVAWPLTPELFVDDAAVNKGPNTGLKCYLEFLRQEAYAVPGAKQG